MRPLADIHHAKTIERIYGYSPIELLQMAKSGRLKLGIYVTKCHIALIKYGTIKDVKTGEKYDGMEESNHAYITDVLYLEKRAIKELLEKGSINTGSFLYPKYGYHAAQMLLSTYETTSIKIVPEDVCVANEDMGIIDPNLLTKNTQPRKRGLNELNEALYEIFRKLYHESVRAKKPRYPSISQIWSYLKMHHKEYVFITKIEGEHIYWVDYKDRPQRLSRDSLKNKLSKFKA